MVLFARVKCGQNNGLGYNINIGWDSALEPPMGDAEYLAAFRSVVMPIAEAYQPQIVLVSCGFDGTEGHPKELGGYKLTPTCKCQIYLQLDLQIHTSQALHHKFPRFRLYDKKADECSRWKSCFGLGRRL